MDVTIDEDTAVVLAVPATVPDNIEILLINLVDELLMLSMNGRAAGDDLNGDLHVLLDVEVDGVRLLALRQESPAPISLLSPREQEIAQMVASGYPNKTIASVLEISTWTVSSHLRRIFMKLQVSSRAAMATRLSGAVLNKVPLHAIDAPEHNSSPDGPPAWPSPVGKASPSLRT